jgi:hypothetical protein
VAVLAFGTLSEPARAGNCISHAVMAPQPEPDPFCAVPSSDALISALFEKQMALYRFGRQAMPRFGLALLLFGLVGFVLGGCI